MNYEHQNKEKRIKIKKKKEKNIVDAVPSEAERELHENIADILRESRLIIQELQQYKGAAKEIKEAISDANEECQRRAREAVVPLVTKLEQFYMFSQKLKETLPTLLMELCRPEMSPCQHLETQQALVKQFAEILEFTLKFDELKMTTPAIQNDLSYYRRTVMRQLDTQSPIGHESHAISLFYAIPTPMLKVVSDTTTKFVNEHNEIPLENTTETFGTMAKVCQRMLENPDLIARFQREETHLFILRVMVALVILYDHVHPDGAFVRASNVDVKGCVKVLKDQPASSSENLLNALRYTTKHLNDNNTPRIANR
ncbi:Protein FAM49B [Armadillidium nasatum]|uniref:Protein FAM49B n=1 Tax=Armadillidium nasatum TaxID=96803 RepID=A0A5N5SJZ8_9CRUS|nr:Protein FAM49B [Armadillidium nasatum]